MTKRGRKRRIVKYGGTAPGWYVWDHIEEPPFLAFVGRYRTRAGARAERESDKVVPTLITEKLSKKRLKNDKT